MDQPKPAPGWEAIARFALGRLTEIRDVIEEVDLRAMETDGPITPTCQEITAAEIRAIYRLSRIPRAYRLSEEARA